MESPEEPVQPRWRSEPSHHAAELAAFKATLIRFRWWLLLGVLLAGAWLYPQRPREQPEIVCGWQPRSIEQEIRAKMPRRGR